MSGGSGGIGGARGGGGPHQVDHFEPEEHAPPPGTDETHPAQGAGPAGGAPDDEMAAAHRHDAGAALIEQRATGNASGQTGARAPETQASSGFLAGVRSRVAGAAREAREAVGDARAEAQRAVAATGRRIEAGGRAITQAAGQVREAVSERVHQTIDGAGRAIQTAGHEAQEAGERVVQRARGIGQRVVEEGGRVVRASEEGVRELSRQGAEVAGQARQTAREALSRARTEAEGVVRSGRELIDRAAAPLDPAPHIAQLNSSGDNVTVSLQGAGQVVVEGAPVRATGQGEMEISRIGPPPAGRPEGYEVEVTGEVGLGLYAQTGPANQRGSANVMTEGSASVTMRFTGPNAREDAERAARVTMRMAAVGVAAGAGAAAGSSLGPVGQVAGTAAAGGVAHLFVGPTGDDLRFMADHVHEVELRGALAAEVSGSLGGSDMRGRMGANASLEAGVQITMPERDAAGEVTRGARVTTFQEGRIGASGSLSSQGRGFGGDVEGTVRLEQEWQLPASATGEALLRDPAGTLSAIGEEARPGPASLAIQGRVRGHAGITGQSETQTAAGPLELSARGRAQAGARMQLKIEGSPEAVGGALYDALNGDLEAAVGTLDEEAKVSGSLETFRDRQVRLAAGVSEERSGQGVELEAEYQLHDRRSHRELGERSPQQAREDLRRFFRGDAAAARP